MRKLFSCFLIAFFMTFVAQAQIVNVNPDPNGDPWLIGGYYVSPEAQLMIDSLPDFETTNTSKSTLLPVVVDNSLKQYFRPIFIQDGGSCAQASGVGYVFTYMVNRMRDLPANIPGNQYPTHFTWNEKNDGVGNGSTMTEGWNIISTNGCPNVQNYGGLYMFPTEPEPCTNRRTVRQTGYNNYFEAMHNMVLDDQFIIEVLTQDELETTKHYLYDLGEGDITKGGGILSFAADMTFQEYGIGTLPIESDEAGKSVLTYFGSNQENHAMTIVGYNDNIKFDFNGDGYFTNTGDDISQWEIGAFKVANSWGTAWPSYNDAGYIYIPYRFFKNKKLFGISINENPYHEPKVTVKVKLHHNKRSRVSLRTGIVEDPNTTNYINITYQQFVGGSGVLPMQGINTDPIEIELDVTKILDGIIPGKFRFWIPMTNNDPTHYGEVLELALYDYDTHDGIPVVTTYPGILPSQIVYGMYNNQFPIEYDYLPSEINTEIVAERDLEIQKDIRILENGVLTISNSTFSLLSDKSIEVYPGGRLIIDNGGELVASGNGRIKIFEDTNNPGVLVFNSGASIQLSDNSTLLEIAGNLEIGQNATFTFTGNGYVKFSNPGVDATYNIACGTGASVLFSGSGQTDKVLEVSQATVHFPEMASLTFENCRIEMASGTPGRRMQADVSYPVTFNNVKITSTTGSNNSHRSFLFIGQSNVTINNCIFEYGQYGLNANLTYTDGAPLYITNSTFRFNSQGLYVYGKGLHLDDCNVINNTSYGVYCNAMSFTSDFTDCSISDNNYGIYYIGSASADIDIENTYIQSNNYDGIKTSGAFDVNMECAFINENRYGLYTLNGTYIKPYTCDISANTYAIYFNYGSFNLLNKYNALQSINDGFTLYGSIPSICGGFNPIILATHNRWESDSDAQPVYNSNYRLWVYNCSPTTTINLSDTDPSYLTCISPFSFSPPSGEILPINQSESLEIADNELPLVTISGTQMPVDEAVPYLSNQLDNIDSETDYIMLIEQYSDIILNCNNYSDIEVKFWMDMAYNDLHNIVSDFYEFVNYDNSNSSFIHGIGDIIQLNKSLLDNPQLIYTDYVEYNLDIALLDRVRDNYSTSITQLETLSSSLVGQNSESEYQFVQSWLCKIKAEKTAKEGLVTIDEFMLAIEDCEICMTNRLTVEDNDDAGEIFEKSTIKEDFTTKSNFYISPNPNDGSFTITLAEPFENCEIRIINSIGQIVKNIKPSQKGLTKITVDGLTTGHYNVVYIIDNKVIDSETVVVK